MFTEIQVPSYDRAYDRTAWRSAAKRHRASGKSD